MKKKKFILNFIYISCICIILYLFYKYLFSVLLPFFIGFVIAAIANSFLKKTGDKFSRIFVLSIMYIILALIIMISGAFIIQLITEYDYTSLYNNRLLPLINTIYTSTLKMITSLPVQSQTALLRIIESLMDKAQDILLSLSALAVSFAANVLSSIPSLFLSTLITIIASFYIALDYENVVHFLVHLVPSKLKELGNDLIYFTKERLGKFLIAYSKLMGINFIECVIGFMLLGIEGVIPLAIMTSIVDVLPILGTGTVLIPWAIIAFFSNKLRGIGLLLMYIIITVIRNVIEPKFVGTSLNLKPLLTFICMIVGLHFAGIIGLFLLPLFAAFIIYIRETKPEMLKSLLD